MLLHRQDAHEAGIVILENRPISLRPVPTPLVSHCVEYILPFIRTQFKNPALMFCRVLYWYDHLSLCSKVQAALATVDILPSSLRLLVQADLEGYTSGRQSLLDGELLLRLQEYVKGTVQRHATD